tara:strand:- start:83 stop:595 length:513 start_codon:yes stop_codon:yes gene_type:complete
MSIDVKEVYQKIRQNLLTDLEQDPETVQNWFTSNVVNRSLSYLSAFKDTGEAVIIRATSGGLIKVSAYPPIFETVERNPTSNADGWIALSSATAKTETFTSLCDRVDIYGKDFEIYYQLSVDGTNFQDKILLRGDINQAASLDFSCKAVKFVNADTGGSEDASFQVIGYR